MSGAKKCLDPLVECSEVPESSTFSEDDAAETLLEDPLRPTTSKSTDAVPQYKKNSDGRKKRTGSRLSLASLFSLSSQGAQGTPRESEHSSSRIGYSPVDNDDFLDRTSSIDVVPHRSRSGWSYGDVDSSSSVVMSSISASDLRAGSVGLSIGIERNRRPRGSDGSQDDVGGALSEMLLAPTETDDINEEVNPAATNMSTFTQEEYENYTSGDKRKTRFKLRECPLCCLRQPISNFPKLVGCSHRSCRLCLMQYVEMEIMENRVEVSCPECTNHLHPADIKKLVGGRAHLIAKYEQFSIRRFLLTEPDARWCPAPDCDYAVIANSCAACPQLKCARENCGALFCYHCKGSWHANQTCDEARRSRGMSAFAASISRRITNASLTDTQLKPGDIKACPRCRTYIVKMDDGSCNHMVCAMCSAEFCWLCLKEISDLHYLSPTGCTFWGKKPWTRKKKLLWQIGTLIGAPVGIALIAGLSIPGIIFGVPVFVGKKVNQRFLLHSKLRRRALTAACVTGSLIVSPVLAVMAVGVGVPIMLAYVYGVVPLSLCRNGGCGLTDSSTDDVPDGIEDEEIWRDASGMERSQLLADSERQLDGTSIAPAMSIQSGSIATNPTRLSVKNAKRARSPSESSSSGRNSPAVNYEEASTKAMAGSHCHFYYDDKSVHTIGSGHGEVISYCEEVASTKALAGSVHDSKSLCESTGGRAAAEVSHHPCACATPSTSSMEHNNRPPVDEAVMSVLRRKLEATRARNAAVVAHPLQQEALHHDSEAAGDSADLDQQPSSSRGGAQAFGHSDSRDEQDPFRIRAVLDNLKQMVAADVPQEKPYEPTSGVRPAVLQKVRRSGSGKSLVTVATHVSVPEVQPLRTDSSPPASRPPKSGGFFRNLFSRRRRS